MKVSKSIFTGDEVVTECTNCGELLEHGGLGISVYHLSWQHHWNHSMDRHCC